MKFKNKYQFQDWLGDLLYKELGDAAYDVSTEENNATGRSQVIVTMKNDDEFILSISMEKGNE